MGKGTPGPVKRVAVPMHAGLELDVNVHFAEEPLLKGQVGDLCPHVEGFLDLRVDLSLCQSVR